MLSADVRLELHEIDKLSEVEVRFGSGKRKLGLSYVTTILKDTVESMIALDIFILTTERLFIRKRLFLYIFFVTAENETHILSYRDKNTFNPLWLL